MIEANLRSRGDVMNAAGEGALIEPQTQPQVQAESRAQLPARSPADAAARAAPVAGLQRITDTNTDWIHRAPQDGIERIEAFFHAHAYDMHRHDTYAIGRTLSGVQSFHYRRGFVHSQPGRTIVIHPDEPHDGEAGTEQGFRYRMVYVEPALFQQALGGRPFIEGGISDDPRLYAATDVLLRGMDCPLDPLERDDAILDLALALDAIAGDRRLQQTADYRAAQLAREYLHDALDHAVTLDALAAATSRDRWSLSRDFRAFFGTSPHRYLTMRRLDRVRQLIVQGRPLADAAAAAGFADQSHMTRHFVKTYGLPPSRWLKTLAAQQQVR
jgi:AraC-like DNA-binding protein